ncbi:MAG: glycosyltransferase family 2 protein [Alphaproteobacteria bacterium]|nr:MAG: glycosyltransferase family 2 protein [Alphaproteobacteria bacterium]
MATSDSPTLSVVIPVYDRRHYLAAAIDSILAQTFADFEVVVVDDGSRDDSVAVVRRYRDPRVRLVRHQHNRGVAAARNTGVAAARGRYVAFLDSDDVAYPDRLARQVAFLDAHPDVAAVGGWMDRMDARGRPLGRVRRRPVAPDDIAAQRLFRPGIQNTTAMARTRVLRRYPHDERFEIGEDFDLWTRIAADCKLANLPRVLVRARRHGAQTTRERAARVEAVRAEVLARHLESLGIGFSDEDLRRHGLLRRMHRERFIPDRAYVDWAEAWLLKLQACNGECRAFPEPAFAHVLGLFWLKACWHASARLGGRVWRRFFASPLRVGAAGGLVKDVALRLPRPFAAARLDTVALPRADDIAEDALGQGTMR